MNLRITDAEWEHNLQVVGEAIDKVAFVRNSKYIR